MTQFATLDRNATMWQKIYVLIIMDILMGKSFWSTKMENLMGGEGNPDPLFRVDAPISKRRIINA